MHSTINMDPLAQIGQKLKTAREAQNLTLRNIYEKTKIPVAHLQGIDSGVDEDLPEPVYVSGYIRRYGDLVGLDGQTLSEEYRIGVEGPTTKKARPAGETHYVPPTIYGRRHNDAPPTFKTIYFNAIWIIVVIGLISYLSMTQLNNQANQSDPSLASLKESASRFTQNSGQTGPGGAPMENGPKGDGSSRLSLSASQHVWVEVKSVASGDSLFTGYLEQGDRRDFQDAQGLRVRADNGGSLSVNFDGKAETFGDAGKVAERTFMAKTAAPASEPVQATAPVSTPSDVRPAASTTRRPTRTAQSTERRERYRNVEESPSRDYIPGESVGGTRSIDVPYRYTEGRLDSE